MRARLGSRLGAIEQVAGEQPPLSELLRLITRPGTPPGHEPAQPRMRHVAETVFEFGNAAVVPYWDQGVKQLRAERDDRARIAISGGIEGLLSTLHPAVRWEPPVLGVPTAAEEDIRLDDRGLLLSPAVFLAPKTCVFIESNGHSAPALAFSTQSNLATISESERSVDGDGKALGALLGHSRAAALQVLTDSCTTSELAQRLGLSMAGASRHATVLRKAGLVRTTRNRNAVLHTLTPLGVALLQRTALNSALSQDRPA